MAMAFTEASKFNQNINAWDTDQVRDVLSLPQITDCRLTFLFSCSKKDYRHGRYVLLC